jgi:predicted nucleic acid-binding protein
LILSVPLALQYEAVLTRPEHLADSGATASDVGLLLDALAAICVPVEISYLWRPNLRDPDDEMVLEAAMNGGADRLLTFNERDFKGVDRFNVMVQRPGPAWRAWRQG